MYNNVWRISDVFSGRKLFYLLQNNYTKSSYSTFRHIRFTKFYHFVCHCCFRKEETVRFVAETYSQRTVSCGPGVCVGVVVGVGVGWMGWLGGISKTRKRFVMLIRTPHWVNEENELAPPFIDVCSAWTAAAVGGGSVKLNGKAHAYWWRTPPAWPRAWADGTDSGESSSAPTLPFSFAHPPSSPTPPHPPPITPNGWVCLREVRTIRFSPHVIAPPPPSSFRILYSSLWYASAERTVCFVVVVVVVFVINVRHSSSSL